MDVLVVVSVDFLFFLSRPAAEWLLQVAFWVFAADHETDLTGGVCGYRSVGVLDVGEDLLAIGFESGNHRKVKPLVLG